MVEEIDNWGVPTLKEFMDQKISTLQARNDEKFSQLQAELQRDRDAVFNRFEDTNHFRETYSDQLNRLANDSLKRGEVDSKFTAQQDKIDANFKAQQEKIDVLGRTNWPVYTSFAGVVISAIVGMWFVINLSIAAQVQPLAVRMAPLELDQQNIKLQLSGTKDDVSKVSQSAIAIAQTSESSKVDRSQLNDRIRQIESKVLASNQADAQSQTDRAQLNVRMHQVEESVSTNNSDRRTNEATTKAALAELEGQLCSQDNIRNLHHANDLRVMTILWSHVPGLGEYPIQNAFYPVVCNKGLYSIK